MIGILLIPKALWVVASLGISTLFTLIGFMCILVIILQIKDLYERLVVGSLTSLLVISGMSAQFFPMILFILILSNNVCIFDYQKGITDSEATKKPHEEH